MNSFFFALGIESWKPILTAALLPPVPCLVLMLIGAGWRRHMLGRTLVWLGAAGVWLGCSTAPAEWLLHHAMPRWPPFGPERIGALKQQATANKPVVIVVLGGGREALAPEYGTASLAPYTLERLRYGLWLGRETGAAVVFSGGIGHGAKPGATEANIAARIATQEFGAPLRWVENASRDTRENAERTVALLRTQPVETLVLVTHAAHMARARRAFTEAAARAGLSMAVEPAPVALAPRIDHPVMRWVPSAEGLTLMRYVVREKLGWWAGA